MSFREILISREENGDNVKEKRPSPKDVKPRLYTLYYTVQSDSDNFSQTRIEQSVEASL